MARSINGKLRRRIEWSKRFADHYRDAVRRANRGGLDNKL